MFVRKSLSHGKVYLSFVQGYRNENGKVKQKTIEKIGYLDDLKKQYDDPISYFKEIAKQKTEEDSTKDEYDKVNKVRKVIVEKEIKKPEENDAEDVELDNDFWEDE